MSELVWNQEEQSIIKPRKFNSHLKCELCKRGKTIYDSAKNNLKMSLKEKHVNPKDVFIVMIKDHALFWRQSNFIKLPISLDMVISQVTSLFQFQQKNNSHD